jgi:hypothetical protein
VIRAVTIALALVSVTACIPGASIKPLPGKLDEPCEETEECDDGLVCASGSDVCKVALEEFCEAHDDCESQLCSPDSRCATNECDAPGEPCDDESLICSGGSCGRFCEPLAIRGQQCSFYTDDSLCDWTHQCAAGLICVHHDFAEFGDGFCAPETDRAVGEPCGSDDDCAAGLVCDEESLNCASP